MKRILIKLSGEQFGGESGKGIDTDVIQLLAEDIKKTKRQTRCGNRNCSGRENSSVGQSCTKTKI